MGISGERPGNLFLNSLQVILVESGTSAVSLEFPLCQAGEPPLRVGGDAGRNEMCHIHVMANWAASSFRKNEPFVLCSLACHPPGL